MTDYDSVLSAAAQLPIDLKIRLIDELWTTSDNVPELSDEWRSEVARRAAELDAGAGRPVSWAEVRDAALERAGLRRAD
ncbi:MAG: addiction module protein [Planctomycetota bacterium]